MLLTNNAEKVQNYYMQCLEAVTTSIREQHFQPKDLAKLWGFSVYTIRKMV
jgi:hypothetical protein